MLRRMIWLIAGLAGLATLILLLGLHPTTAAPASAAPGTLVQLPGGNPTAPPTATAPIPPGCSLAWRVVSSPNGSGDNFLTAVAVDGPSTLWAVGSAGTQTLIERWDGST